MYESGEVHTMPYIWKTGKKRDDKETLAGVNNKGRFCNTIASVALVHTSIQSD